MISSFYVKIGKEIYLLEVLMKKAIGWLSLGIIAILLLSFYLSTLSFNSQQVFRIGVLISGAERFEKVKGLQQGLLDLGFDQQQIEFTIRDSHDLLEQMKRDALELTNMNLDLIVTGGAIETSILQEVEKQNHNKTPIIFMGVADAVRLHLVEERTQPGGNTTGLENGHVELSGKRLQLLKLLLPEIENVLVLYDDRIEASIVSLQMVMMEARREGIMIEPFVISDNQELEDFKMRKVKPNEAILVLPSFYYEKISKELAALALSKKVPIFGVNLHDVENGFLLSYGISYYEQGIQTATYVSKVLQGVDPAMLPVEMPDTVQLFVNADTEQTLGITFNPIGASFIQRLKGQK